MDAAVKTVRSGWAAPVSPAASTSHHHRLQELPTPGPSLRRKEISHFLTPAPGQLSTCSRHRTWFGDGRLQQDPASPHVCACTCSSADSRHGNWLEHDLGAIVSSFSRQRHHTCSPRCPGRCRPRSLLSNSASTDGYVSHNRTQQELKTPPNRVAPAREVVKDAPSPPPPPRAYSGKVNGTSNSKADQLLHNGSPGLHTGLGSYAGGIVPPPSPQTQKPLTNFLATLATVILAVEKQRRADEAARRTQVSIDSLKRGRLVENDLVYRQQFVIRSYEVSYDRTASIETLTNLFQETALNHVGMSDFVGDGMGTTHAMMRHRLIWVVTRMHIEVDRYPVWGDVVEIDSWVCGTGKNGMRRDFLVSDYASGNVLARATSTWVMMNQDTRRLSKMPDDVRAEISPYFLDRSVLEDKPTQKIPKLDDSAPYIRSDLVPRLNDMDMNQHVNNVKYIGWVLESVPQSLLVAHELTSMILEYRRECSHSDVVQSMTCPEPESSSTLQRPGSCGTNGAVNGSANGASNGSANGSLNGLTNWSANGSVNGSPKGSTYGSVNGHKSILPSQPPRSSGHVQYTHLLRMQSDLSEIVRGRTVWRLKGRYIQ